MGCAFSYNSGSGLERSFGRLFDTACMALQELSSVCVIRKGLDKLLVGKHASGNAVPRCNAAPRAPGVQVAQLGGAALT